MSNAVNPATCVHGTRLSENCDDCRQLSFFDASLLSREQEKHEDNFVSKSVAAKIIEQKESFERANGRPPDCVIVDSFLEDSIPKELYDSRLLIYGMHLVVADGMPHGVIRCGIMR